MKDTLPKKTVPFKQVIEALLDDSQVFPAIHLHRFSDLNGDDLKALKEIWDQVPTNRRTTLLEDLEDLYEADTLASFEEVARLAISDSHAPVRAAALRLLWDYQGKDLIPVYQLLLEKDPDELVRALAASILGQYVYLGELDEISTNLLRAIEDALFQTVESGEAKLVRRRALESIGYSSRDEIPALIRNAFDSGDFEWMASALFAMGRSSDESWSSVIMEMLDHHERDVQLEAVRAAGLLELQAARKPLLRMVKAGIDDSELRSVVAWSLSQIGGEGVADALDKMLEKAEDDEEAEFIEGAIDNLEFGQGLDDFEMLNFAPARSAHSHATGAKPEEEVEENEIGIDDEEFDDLPEDEEES
jgi:hypothetical protein